MTRKNYINHLDAERAAAKVWELSPREREMQRLLGERGRE